MPIKKIDIKRADIANTEEQSSDGSFVYLSNAPISLITSSTKTIIINKITDGEGLTSEFGLHPVRPGDVLVCFVCWGATTLTVPLAAPTGFELIQGSATGATAGAGHIVTNVTHVRLK